MRKLFIAVAVLLLLSVCSARDKKASASPVFADVTSRGRALYEYDQAVWHATDAVQALHPAEGLVKRYIARKTDSGWVVAFGRLNERRDTFLIAYEAHQGATLTDFSVKKQEQPKEDTSFYFSGAKAIDSALHDFRGQSRPYNVALLPSESNQLYVYVLPAQVKTDIYPLGGDVRYLVSADGETVMSKREMHKTILETPPPPPGSTTAAGYHTHVLTDTPEDSDVFHVLTQKPPVPEFVGITKRKAYEITVDGSIFETKM